MGLTSTRLTDGTDVWGQYGVCIRKFTGDSAYPSGGYTLRGSNFGFGTKPLKAVLNGGALTALGATLNPIFDVLNQKLVINSGAPSEYNYVPGGGDIKGSANTDFVGAGGYTTLPTNGALISALAAADNTTAFTIAVNPDVSRNIALVVKDTSAGAADGNAADYVIVGTFRNAAQTETISFTALNLATMSNGNIAVKYGVKPFDTVTSITPSAAQPTGFEHAAGVGSLLGLPVPTLNNVETDIISITKNGAYLSPTGLFSTNQTVLLGTLANGDDVAILYRASGAVAPGTDLSGCSWALIGLCRGT